METGISFYQQELDGMQTSTQSDHVGSAKREYHKPELARRERLADVTQGDAPILPTGAVQVG